MRKIGELGELVDGRQVNTQQGLRGRVRERIISSLVTRHKHGTELKDCAEIKRFLWMLFEPYNEGQ
jgi:hypothetical protein